MFPHVSSTGRQVLRLMEQLTAAGTMCAGDQGTLSCWLRSFEGRERSRWAVGEAAQGQDLGWAWTDEHSRPTGKPGACEVRKLWAQQAEVGITRHVQGVQAGLRVDGNKLHVACRQMVVGEGGRRVASGF